MKSTLFQIVITLLAASILRAEAQLNESVIITEIFADPTPSHGLPEKEFIELYNSSNKELDLLDFRLFYSNTDVTFPSYVLSPGAYVIVCRSNNVVDWQSFGPTVGLSKFSLLNGGDRLRLEDKQGNLVFMVNYNEDWYTPGRDQGYSLEMIDMNYPCREFGNWTSSSAEKGATPGIANASAANLPDTEGPVLLSYASPEPTKYVFTFSEKLSPEAVNMVTVNDQKVSVEWFIDQPHDLIVHLANPIPENEISNFEFPALSDCSGNISAVLTLEIGNIASPEIGEIVLTEILFDPFIGGSDYIEIKNVTEKFLDLKGLKFANVNSMGEVDNEVEISDKSFVIKPKEVICFTTDPSGLANFYLNTLTQNVKKVNRLPSFPNELGTVILMGPNHEEFERFSYNEEMHHSSIDDAEGLSLERVSLDRPVDDLQNWQTSLATPGYWTSRIAPNNDLEIILSAPSFVSDDQGLGESIEVEIRTKDIGNVSANIFDINGKKVKNVFANVYTSGSRSFVWDGLGENSKLLSQGYYILHVQYYDEEKIIEKASKILLLSSR